MDADFWHERWRDNRIGFHESGQNELFLRHWPALALEPGSRVFLPLCGRTLAIGWLRGKGHRVVGAELSAVAVEQLLDDLGVTAERTVEGALVRHRTPGLDLLVGDIFDVTSPALGAVDAVFDRAALVALPREMRRRYARHLVEITDAAPHLLISFDYDQTAMDGPPFSVPADEVRELYSSSYDVARLERVEVPGGLKGQCAAWEEAWLLRPRTAEMAAKQS